MKKYVMITIFCFLKIPKEDEKFLTTTPGKNSLKVSFIICAEIECLLQKISTCQNKHEKSYAEKKVGHEASGYSLITCCSFDKSENEKNITEEEIV